MIYIYAQDTNTATLVIERLQKALNIIVERPMIGTRTAVSGLYRFPIPKTGHTIEYRVGQKSITVMRWLRQTRKV
jgi:plasmid stabilization system protein ParE